MALNPNNRPNQPIAKFETMLKTDDVYFFDAEDFEEIIHHYLNNGKISLAKKAIKIGQQQHPDTTSLKLLNVEVHVFENNLEVAEQMLNELQLLDSNNEEIYIQRANIYSKKDNHVAAIKLLNKALAISNESLDIYSLLGMEYLFMDDFESAKQSFIKCVSKDSHDYSSLYNVIYCFEFLEDFEGAVYYLNDYLDNHPYSEVAWHQLGKQYMSLKLYKEALTAFDFAIISDDTFIGAYFEKGKVLEKLGKYEEAIENYETTITIQDPTSHAYLRIGKCHEKLNNTAMAKYFYYHTVHEDPLLDKGWMAITDFYFRQKDYEKSLYYINKALNIDAENSLYWKRAAKIYSALENFTDANMAFKQTVELGNYELDTWLSWADVVIKNGNLFAAIEILKQGYEFYPENAAIPYILAGLYLEINNKNKARVHLVNALETDFEQRFIFEETYPHFSSSTWVKNIIADCNRPSS